MDACMRHHQVWVVPSCSWEIQQEMKRKFGIDPIGVPRSIDKIADAVANLPIIWHVNYRESLEFLQSATMRKAVFGYFARQYRDFSHPCPSQVH